MLLLSLALVLAYATFVFIDGYRKGQIAKDNVVLGRESAESYVDGKVDEAIDTLQKSGVVIDRLGSSKVDVCYIDYRGKSPDSWYQDCYLRYVEGFSTSLTIDEVRSKLLSNPRSISIFGNDSSKMQTNPDYLYCTLFDRFNHTDDYRTELQMIPANTKGGYGECEIPDLLQSYGSVKGHIKLSDELSVKEYNTFDSSSIDNSQNQIWLMFNKHYYHEELGCVKTIVCTKPRSKPAHPSI